MSSKHNIVVAIDPGFGGTGMVMFVDGRLYRFTNVVEKTKDDERYAELSNKCAKLALEWLSDLYTTMALYEEGTRLEVDVVVEDPHAMGGIKGVASLLRGDVFKVAKLAGAIGSVLYLYIEHTLETMCEENAVRLHYPEVRRWKGQLSKMTTKRRVLRDVTYAVAYIKIKKYELQDKYPSHIFDAAGLGMWFIKHGDHNESKKESSL